MKREGWKHGMDKGVDVRRRSLLHARAKYTSVRHLESSPMTGVQAQLLLKPTNSSKFTGKCRKARCRSCHYHPVSKSKDKAKGAYKLRSRDVALNHRLVSWRVVDEGSTLSGNRWYEGEDADDDDDDHDIKHGGQSIEPDNYSCEEIIHESELESEEKLMKAAEDYEQTIMIDSEEDDDMGFCKVGNAREYTDEEDWLVVQEI